MDIVTQHNNDIAAVWGDHIVDNSVDMDDVPSINRTNIGSKVADGVSHFTDIIGKEITSEITGVISDAANGGGGNGTEPAEKNTKMTLNMVHAAVTAAASVIPGWGDPKAWGVSNTIDRTVDL